VLDVGLPASRRRHYSPSCACTGRNSRSSSPTATATQARLPGKRLLRSRSRPPRQNRFDSKELTVARGKRLRVGAAWHERYTPVAAQASGETGVAGETGAERKTGGQSSGCPLYGKNHRQKSCDISWLLLAGSGSTGVTDRVSTGGSGSTGGSDLRPSHIETH